MFSPSPDLLGVGGPWAGQPPTSGCHQDSTRLQLNHQLVCVRGSPGRLVGHHGVGRGSEKTSTQSSP
eukprot:3814137-Amphidinium_carterae.1